MDSFIIGAACTHFGKHPNKSFKQLTREAFEAVINDACLDDGNANRENLLRQREDGRVRTAEHPRPSLLHGLGA